MTDLSYKMSKNNEKKEVNEFEVRFILNSEAGNYIKENLMKGVSDNINEWFKLQGLKKIEQHKEMIIKNAKKN